jgi:hypothetical protein
MKHPVKLASLPNNLTSIIEHYGDTVEAYELMRLPAPDRGTLIAYLDNMNQKPQNFPVGSEAYDQWTYTGRKKKDKETLKRASQSNNP